MTRIRLAAIGTLLVLLTGVGVAEDKPAKRAPKEALQAVQELVGNWRGSGRLLEGSRDEKAKGIWEETIHWEWQFKDKDVFLKATFDKGKYFTTGELRYLPEKDVYQLTATTPAKDKVVYEGQLKDKRLTLERIDDKTKDVHRLIINLLHDNRQTYQYEVKLADKPAFRAMDQVGATSTDMPFAATDHSKDCVVSGGLGKMPVMYMGKTYYVCCGGCKDAFNEDPAKYVKEFEERLSKNKKD